jgi:6-phosphogluconolactonase
MSHPARLIVVAGRAELARRAAEEVARLARAALAARGAFHIALAGGSTPRELYELLARTDGLELGRWHAWFGDERCVGPDDERSNFRMARRALLEPGGIPRERWHPMRAWEGDPEQVARAYEAELRAALGPAPRLDFALLGMGADGHTASLFPGSAALLERERGVVAVPAGVGRELARVSLTLPVLAAARELLFVVAGEDKRVALAAVLSCTDTGSDLPARRVSEAHRDPLWIVDRAARGAGTEGGLRLSS